MRTVGYLLMAIGVAVAVFYGNSNITGVVALMGAAVGGLLLIIDYFRRR